MEYLNVEVVVTPVLYGEKLSSQRTLFKIPAPKYQRDEQIKEYFRGLFLSLRDDVTREDIEVTINGLAD